MMQLKNYYYSLSWKHAGTNLTTAVKGCKLFRRGRQGRRYGDVALYVTKCTDCEELPLRNSYKQTENLWLKIKDQTDKEHLVARVYYSLPDKWETVVEAILLQLCEDCNPRLLS